MKRFMGTMLPLVFCICMLAGCSGARNADVSTVFVEKSGKIASLDIEDLDKDYYDESELKEEIKENIEEYTAENGDTVKQKSFRVKDGVASLEMEYDSYVDYSKLNGIEFYSGTIVQAKAEGYDFDGEFVSVSNGEKGDAASSDDVQADDDNKVAVIRANVAVQVDGEILFVSAQDTEIAGKDTVRITGEESNEEAPLTYIIYQ